MNTPQTVYEKHASVVTFSQHAFVLSVAAVIYDDCCKQEQRLLRELNKIQNKLLECQTARKKYGKLIGAE